MRWKATCCHRSQRELWCFPLSRNDKQPPVQDWIQFFKIIGRENLLFTHQAHSIRFLSNRILVVCWKIGFFEPIFIIFEQFGSKLGEIFCILTLGSFDSFSFDLNIGDTLKNWIFSTHFHHFWTFLIKIGRQFLHFDSRLNRFVFFRIEYWWYVEKLDFSTHFHHFWTFWTKIWWKFGCFCSQFNRFVFIGIEFWCCVENLEFLDKFLVICDEFEVNLIENRCYLNATFSQFITTRLIYITECISI